MLVDMSDVSGSGVSSCSAYGGGGSGGVICCRDDGLLEEADAGSH
jgi:hypothetical protein